MQNVYMKYKISFIYVCVYVCVYGYVRVEIWSIETFLYQQTLNTCEISTIYQHI